jgi:hypothetical protein
MTERKPREYSKRYSTASVKPVPSKNDDDKRNPLSVDVTLVPTVSFSVLELPENGNSAYRSSKDYVASIRSKPKCVRDNISKYGFSILQDIMTPEKHKESLKIIKSFARELINKYDFTEDEFADVDQEEMNIVRMPRIGRGKHNIHFDPEFSPQHKCMEEVMKQSGVLEQLSKLTSCTCSLRETGLSMTSPMVQLGPANDDVTEWKRYTQQSTLFAISFD